MAAFQEAGSDGIIQVSTGAVSTLRVRSATWLLVLLFWRKPPKLAERYDVLIACIPTIVTPKISNRTWTRCWLLQRLAKHKVLVRCFKATCLMARNCRWKKTSKFRRNIIKNVLNSASSLRLKLASLVVKKTVTTLRGCGREIVHHSGRYGCCL